MCMPKMSGEDLLKQVESLYPEMPGIDGLKVIKYVREKARLARLKILVISALSDEHLNAAVAAGADDVLSEPFDAGVLLEKVTSLLNTEASM